MITDDVRNRMERAADLRTAVGALAVFVIATVLVQAVGFRPDVTAMANGLALPEMVPLYSPADVQAVMEALGAEGRSLYINALLVDFLFVITFAAGLGLPLAYLLPRVTDSTAVRTLALAPVVAGLCDWVENLVLLYTIGSYPDGVDALLWVASVFTTVKVVLLPVSILAILVSVVVVVARRL